MTSKLYQCVLPISGHLKQQHVQIFSTCSPRFHFPDSAIRMSKDALPSNVRVLSSPAFASKLENLRDRSIKPRAVRKLTAELSTILAAEAFSTGNTASKAALIVVLRSGLAMQDPFLDQAPSDLDVFVYHLGLFRDTVTLEPVEYYNKLPTRDPSIKHAYIVDPLIATGGTAAATINILRYASLKFLVLLHEKR